MKNKPYLIALNSIKKIGPSTIKKFLTAYPNLETLFQTSAAKLEAIGFPFELAKAIAHFNWNEVEKQLKWAQQKNHYLLTWEDANYPSLLKEIPDPPPVLYAIGNPGAFQEKMIAIVGTRKPSIAGSENAWDFAYNLAKENFTVVSGLALGVDAQAHLGCLAAHGKTIAVLGTGVDYIYPYRHIKLAEKIQQDGLLLSELPLQTKPVAGHFPRRNRIISGLSLATLVVEAAIRSGSLITANLALEQNREVLAIPGSINNPQARGCHHLLQQGAKLITSVQDILTELGFAPTVETKSSANLANYNENLVKFIGFEVTTINQIIQRSGFSLEKVTCELAELEVNGLIKAVPGGYMRSTV
ncbi:protein smf (plasmid) [Legionella adelaidensis]|uniref:Protein smf n=1 Tax=Legionella adelaidensis TaxID=45056 RepID=A0A0W0R5U4_9GAMM|nr:DNA-processing protein DprA [Legionella adelaidensis]KTC66411.1 protein smf [Legionella adelaidensis]VEH85009.1 protein smf [Legionella adelaidensis]